MTYLLIGIALRLILRPNISECPDLIFEAPPYESGIFIEPPKCKMKIHEATVIETIKRKEFLINDVPTWPLIIFNNW